MTDTILPVAGGLLNKEIIDHAYLSIGVSDSMFGRTAEEYGAGLMHLRALMGEYPFDQLGFDDAGAAVGEESGIARRWLSAVAYSLGERIGASIGKALIPQFVRIKVRAVSELDAWAYASSPPTVTLGRGDPYGSGHRGFVRTFTTGDE